jgi:D-amino-acid dehydrogenase
MGDSVVSEGRVVIVGGGIIGLACAHYLQKTGASVTVIDQGRIGGGCSHGNCGYVSPSHILPFAGPGAIPRTLKTLFQRNSPLKVRFRFSPALWGWFLRFARRCNQTDMLEAGHAIDALLRSSRTLYDQLLEEAGFDVEFEARGIIFVLRTAEGMHHYEQVDRLLRDEFNLPAKRLDGPALDAYEPALKPGLAGGWLYECDAHLRCDRLLREWRARLSEQGVSFREQCELKGITSSGRIVSTVVTSQGPIPADRVVIATGAWTPLLHEHLGVRVPIQRGKGYSITMPRPALCPRVPLIFEEHRVAITPFRSGYRIGSTMEFAGYDASMNRDRFNLLREGAAMYLREPVAEPVEEEWWGWRPMVPDGKPIIGRLPKFDNAWVAAGHGMLGLSMATGTGKLISELIGGSTPHVDPAPYRVERFA